MDSIIFSYILLLIIIFGIFGFFIYLYSQKKEKESILKSFEMTLFLVTLPKYELKKEEKEAKQDKKKSLIALMEQVYTNFLYFDKKRRKILISLEIASEIGGSDISFYVAVPKEKETGFEKYITAVYPRAVVEKIPQDYTIFEPECLTAGGFLKVENGLFLPIATYKNLEEDPLASLTNALSKISVDEGAAIQVIIRPASTIWRKRVNSVLSKVREGKSLSQAISETYGGLGTKFLKEIPKSFSSQQLIKSEKKTDVSEKESKRTNERLLKAIESKVEKEFFEVNIRLVSSAKTQERAEEILSHLESSFGQFSLFGFNGFKSQRVKGKRLEKLIYDYSFRNFNEKEKIILNIEELTSIYHFPTYFTETPYVKGVKSVFAPPPAELPEKGIVTIGKVRFRGQEKIVSFATKEDRRRHFYIIGQTGVGKSSLLREMIRQDIESGEGVGVIDPHGDLIEATLANIPKERIDDVVLFEPFDVENPPGLNMLEWKNPMEKDFAVSGMIAIFTKLFPPEVIGPMFEHYMRNAMLAIMADKENPGTLVEIPRIFTDDQFMEERLTHVKDPLVRNFWLKEWKQTIGQTRSDMLGYVVSKVGRFIENETMRNIIGQSHSTFDLDNIIKERKIFLANLSKGQIGEINSSLLGMILVEKIQIASMRQGLLPEEERKDFYLYIDEFQNFTTDTVATILAEARKYRLNLIIAHQYIPQLKEEIKNAVIGNVGSIASFRIGPADAEFMEKQFEPEFSKYDLVNLDNFTYLLKLMIKNKVYPPFKVESFPPKKGNPEIVPLIKKLSKKKYTKPREIVEKEIIQRSRLGEL